MDQRQQMIEARRAELQKLDAQSLLVLAHRNGINLLNGPFVIEQILRDEFPELKHEKCVTPNEATP